MTPKIFVLFLTDSQFPFFPLQPTLVELGLHISRAESSFKMFMLGSQVTRSARAWLKLDASCRPEASRSARLSSKIWMSCSLLLPRHWRSWKVVSLLIMETGFVICSFTSWVELEQVQIELDVETCSFAALGTRANKCKRYLQHGRFRQWIACMSGLDWRPTFYFMLGPFIKL